MPTSHSRVALRHLKKTSGTDFYMKAKGEVRKVLDNISPRMDSLLKEMAGQLKRRGLTLDMRKSSIEWYMHGSDGLRMTFDLFMDDSRENPMHTDEVREALEAELGVWATPSRRGQQWYATYGD